MEKRKTERIPASALEEIAQERFPNIVTEDWYGTELVIKRNLSLAEMLQFVNDIVETCFAEDGSFIPEAAGFAIRSGVLTRYANFELPDDLEKQYELVYGTGAAEVVAGHINSAQLKEIIEAADQKIEHLLSSDIIALRGRIDELTAAFERLGEQMSGMFEGLEPEDVQNMLSAIGSAGSLSEEKIVDIYMDRRMGEAGHGKA